MKLVETPEKILECKNLVGGSFVSVPSKESLVFKSPYTGKDISRVPLSGPAEVSATVSKAAVAFPAWRETPIKERCQILFRFREIALRELERLSNSVASESGKTMGEARAGILKGLEVVEFALSLQNLDSGGRMEVSRGVWCHYKREPLGVVCGITPFNFPAMVPLWMLPIAIALGNSFILKPSEKVSLTPQILGELLVEAGLPSGVFSIVNGDRAAVEALIDHPEVKAIGFVGSSAVARSVYLRATALGKRALCLGGAKNHIIVVPDAEESLAIRGVVDSFTGCAGQRCMAASVLLAVGSVDRIIEGIHSEASRRQPGMEIGALIDSAARDRLCAALDTAEKEGAKIILDGRKVKAPAGYEGGNWLGASIIDSANPKMECALKELFGPILTIIRVNSLTDALKIEASSNYGNATSVFTTSGPVSSYVSENATSGMIGINIGVPVPREPFSFGGTKDSKFGQGEMTGEGALDLWSNQKKITTKWTMQSDATWMS